MSEALLPPEILAKADVRHDEYAWRIGDLPEVIEAARAQGLRNIGGQLQIRTEDAIGECDWVQIDACQLIPPMLPWEAQVEMAANVALQDLQLLKAEFNFAREIKEAFPEPVERLLAAGGKIEDAIWFVWYADTEADA
ncbi:hypothetical protein [Asticcacaulis benevestitus]|uniref:Uncharacterized protein n=1 Tax=Asticcacaulis benevestitus DSM 16100 = ATCC BAA-896 TaxID=1121022 RepID=V4PCK7_9CAUL|nr:hypothetical protein [Asticcacaulis benevestitus]ESQ91637.1 hypothetical protein ABENE_09890 [Asticcacaulis benevestitus DSM 16100 = ATCC BAA-896]